MEKEVIIIGGVVSGLGMAVQLQRLLGHENFTIYEKSDDIGGTWWHNRYPACACDIPSHLYSYSFALEPDWSSTYPGRDELHCCGSLTRFVSSELLRRPMPDQSDDALFLRSLQQISSLLPRSTLSCAVAALTPPASPSLGTPAGSSGSVRSKTTSPAKLLCAQRLSSSVPSAPWTGRTPPRSKGLRISRGRHFTVRAGTTLLISKTRPSSSSGTGPQQRSSFQNPSTRWRRVVRWSNWSGAPTGGQRG